MTPGSQRRRLHTSAHRDSLQDFRLRVLLVADQRANPSQDGDAKPPVSSVKTGRIEIAGLPARLRERGRSAVIDSSDDRVVTDSYRAFAALAIFLYFFIRVARACMVSNN